MLGHHILFCLLLLGSVTSSDISNDLKHGMLQSKLNYISSSTQRSTLQSTTTLKSSTAPPKTTSKSTPKPTPKPPSSKPCNLTMFTYYGDGDTDTIGSFESNSTGISARWMATHRDWYCLELKANLSASSYMALGFSNGGMGPAPVVACSRDDPFKFPLYWNSADNSLPAYNSTADLQTTVNTTEGTTTCYIAISSRFSVFPNSSSPKPEQFDLNFNPYHLALASGPVKNGSLR